MVRIRRRKEKVDCDAIKTEGTKKKAKIVKEDRISKLPDDILIRILSLLNVKHAQETSFLSKRWRNLWKHITSLSFAIDLTRMAENSTQDEIIEMDSVLINWVNKVCSLIQSPSIERLTIDYKLYATGKDFYDAYFRNIPIKEGVDLDLLKYTTFQSWTLPVLSGFKDLRSLKLNNVNLSGETIEHFLLHCSLLEQISIENSDRLKSLKVGAAVGGPLCRHLKLLKIFDCYDLDDLKICAPKLSNFQFEGSPPTYFHINDVPLLSHVYVGQDRSNCCLTRVFSALSTQLSQIQTLELCLDVPQDCNCEPGSCAWGNMDFSPLSKLSSLRELTMTVTGSDDGDFLFLLSFLKVSPFLEKIKLEIQNCRSTGLLEETNIALRPHQNLKVLEVCGFKDLPSTVNFVQHISRVALRLEKVVIDPFQPAALKAMGCRLVYTCDRILFTKQFEALFEEVLRSSGINERIKFVLGTMG